MFNKYDERINALRPLMAKAGVDAFYVSGVPSVAYFTGKKGDDCALYITQDEAFIITDFRYHEMAEEMSGWLKFAMTKQDFTTVDFLKSRKEKTIGVERNYMSLSVYLDFTEDLKDKKIVPIGDPKVFSGLVEDLRKIKDEEEQALTAKAEKIGCDAFNYILTYIQPGKTEKDIALTLENYMQRHGAEALSFDTICVSGTKSSYCHGVPDSKLIEDGDFLTMDFGCKVGGYCSDMTRTVAVGHATDEMRNIYGIVLKAQLNCCNNIKAGITGIEGHKLAYDVIEAAGYGEYFGHGLGHGTGLEIHEAPRFSFVYPGIIPENAIMSIEPGIYIPGKFGVRIEDLAIIKADGIINLAQSAPKELIII